MTGNSLTHMKLSGLLKIDDSVFVNLPSLKYLCLTSVWIDDDVLFILVIRCPSLEKLVIADVINYELNISSLSLKFLKVDAKCKIMGVEAANLQFFLFYDWGTCSRVSFSACRTIKHLVLSDFRCIEDQNLDEQISKLTLLENLTLKCYDFGL